MKLKQDEMGIGQNLQKLRKQTGLSQSQFTRELQLLGLNISYDIYKKMEQNKYNIRISELIAIKHILQKNNKDISFDDFFDGLSIEDIIKIKNEDT